MLCVSMFIMMISAVILGSSFKSKTMDQISDALVTHIFENGFWKNEVSSVRVPKMEVFFSFPDLASLTRHSVMFNKWNHWCFFKGFLPIILGFFETKYLLYGGEYEVLIVWRRSYKKTRQNHIFEGFYACWEGCQFIRFWNAEFTPLNTRKNSKNAVFQCWIYPTPSQHA